MKRIEREKNCQRWHGVKEIQKNSEFIWIVPLMLKKRGLGLWYFIVKLVSWQRLQALLLLVASRG